MLQEWSHPWTYWASNSSTICKLRNLIYPESAKKIKRKNVFSAVVLRKAHFKSQHPKSPKVNSGQTGETIEKSAPTTADTRVILEGLWADGGHISSFILTSACPDTTTQNSWAISKALLISCPLLMGTQLQSQRENPWKKRTQKSSFQCVCVDVQAWRKIFIWWGGSS